MEKPAPLTKSLALDARCMVRGEESKPIGWPTVFRMCAAVEFMRPKLEESMAFREEDRFSADVW